MTLIGKLGPFCVCATDALCSSALAFLKTINEMQVGEYAHYM